MEKRLVRRAAVVTAALAVIFCGPVFAGGKQEARKTIRVAAAASLKNVFEQKLIPQFEKRYAVKVEGVYDSSGKLQTQIEQGLDADVFMSAAATQMDALVKKGLIDGASVIPLLQNKLVLIKRKGTNTKVTDFSTVTQAASIAIGDPASVPAGSYAKEAFTKIGNWNAVNSSEKVSLGTNVTEVLNWVAAGSAEVGVVYATDAASQKQTEVIAVLPDNVLSSPVIYPLGRAAKTSSQTEADLFIAYLTSPGARAVFKSYGFSPNT
jgi:molybdate transport system substrate-binding protein